MGWGSVGRKRGIVLGVMDLETSQPLDIALPITRWHEGVGDPYLFGSLELKPIRLSIVGQWWRRPLRSIWTSDW